MKLGDDVFVIGKIAHVGDRDLIVEFGGPSSVARVSPDLVADASLFTLKRKPKKGSKRA